MSTCSPTDIKRVRIVMEGRLMETRPLGMEIKERYRG
jgi:hypothetical protein